MYICISFGLAAAHLAVECHSNLWNSWYPVERVALTMIFCGKYSCCLRTSACVCLVPTGLAIRWNFACSSSAAVMSLH